MADFDLKNFWSQQSREHIDTAQATFGSLESAFARWLDLCANSIENGGKILFFGNGGSAADAQHLATELSVRYAKDRAPIAALALTTDTSTLTAAANDMGFDAIFARQVEAIGKPGDVAVGISTSGKSPNVLKALETARKNGLVPTCLTGANGKAMADICDAALIVPSIVTARIQEMHITLGQMLCGALEQRLDLI